MYYLLVEIAPSLAVLYVLRKLPPRRPPADDTYSPLPAQDGDAST